MESDSNHRQELGKIGEDLACRLLERSGHMILERNFRSGHLEIDIISVNPEGIHFVEVKARRNSIQAPPQDCVGKTKQEKITKAALRYLKSAEGRQFRNMEYMFDVIAVTFEGDEVRTEMFPQAFIPIYY